MIPRVAQRGHSFKGAGQYYLHDKKADTNERVDWTYVHNLPTENPEMAMKWMARTAMSAERLKAKSGVAATGRKSTAGEVYSYSLAWHPHQSPDQEVMMESAFQTLELLNLFDHEAVFVAHKETDHPHVHVICNLIHPDTGKVSAPSYDRLKLSAWAEELERNEGQIRCEQRVINNAKRNNHLDVENKRTFVKHREEKLQRAQLIQDLYQKANNPVEFEEELKSNGYTLAQGNRREFVLVNEEGSIYSLSRQLKGQRAKDIRQKLDGLSDLPLAKELSFERQHFDREKYEREQQQSIDDAGIEHDKAKNISRRNNQNQGNIPNQNLSPNPRNQDKPDDQTPTYEPDDHLTKLDALREWEQKKDRLLARLETLQADQYQREALIKEIREAEFQLNKAKGKSKTSDDQEQLENLKRNKENVDRRIQEQNDAANLRMEESKPGDESTEELKRKRLENLRNKSRDQDNDKNRDHEP